MEDGFVKRFHLNKTFFLNKRIKLCICFKIRENESWYLRRKVLVTMEKDILDSPIETKHMPPSPSQPIHSPHSSTSQHVTPVPSKHVTPVHSQHNTPVHSQYVNPVPSKHVTPVHSQHVTPVHSQQVTPVHSQHVTPVPSRHVTPVPSRHVTPVQSPHAPPLPFQNLHLEDFMKPLEINEEESMLPTPRYTRIIHHTLHYLWSVYCKSVQLFSPILVGYFKMQKSLCVSIKSNCCNESYF